MDADGAAHVVLAGRGGAAQDGLDAGLDLKDIEGLGHIVVRAVFQPQNFVDLFTLGGQHDDRYIAVLPDPLAHGDTVHLRQHHVQQDEVVMACKELGQRFVAVSGGIRLEAFLFQRIFQTLNNQGLIVNKEDAFRHGKFFPFCSALP